MGFTLGIAPLFGTQLAPCEVSNALVGLGPGEVPSGGLSFAFRRTLQGTLEEGTP